MGFDLNVSVPALTVFLQGILSFFSPCVLPLIPLYIGYLSGGTITRNENGNPVYNQKKVMLHTICFVLGVSFAIFLLGLGASAIAVFFNSRQKLLAQIGGVLIVLFGLYQMGFFGTSEFLSRERKLPFHLEKMTMSPVTALIMGFTFSFAWTPCVGPALTSVLLMTASSSSQAAGFLLIGLYTLGFAIPFLLVGLFTTKLLSFFQKHRSVVKYTVKIGGLLLVVMGILVFTGKMNSMTGYLSSISGDSSSVKEGAAEAEQEMKEKQETEEEPEQEEEPEKEEPETEEEPEVEEAGVKDYETEESETGEETASESSSESTSSQPMFPAPEFSLTDQYGNTHTLSDYKGKTIFLNFWATWCPPCKSEMPDIQKLYETYSTEGEDAVIILGVAAPGYGQEGSEEEIAEFLEENGYTYPVLMDADASMFEEYQVSALPTTFMIDRDGGIFGYITGQLSEENMKQIIESTLTGKLEK